MIHDQALMINYQNETNKCICRYVNYYTGDIVILLRIPVTNWGHLQGLFFKGYIKKKTQFRFYVLCNISFQKHLPADGHHRWLKHVRGLQHL